MPPLKTPHAKFYVLPTGYIELTEAVFLTVKLLFGRKFASKFSGEAELRNELDIPKKQRRDRRWDLVRSCFRRAFQQNRLASYLLINGSPARIDAKFWREPMSATHPFGTATLGKHGVEIFMLKIVEWQEWANRSSPHWAAANVTPLSNSSPIAVATEKPNRRGPKPLKHMAIVAKMIGDLENGKTTVERLSNDTLEVLKSDYKASGNTANKARKSAVEQYLIKTLKITEQ
jgi:hypothetical protein